MGPLSKKPAKLDLVVVMAFFIALEMSEGRVMYGPRIETGRSSQKILEVTDPVFP